MRVIILSPLACPDLPYYSTLSNRRHNFREKLWIIKLCLMGYKNFIEIFLILRRIQQEIIINVPVIVVRC